MASLMYLCHISYTFKCHNSDSFLQTDFSCTGFLSLADCTRCQFSPQLLVFNPPLCAILSQMEIFLLFLEIKKLRLRKFKYFLKVSA